MWNQKMKLKRFLGILAPLVFLIVMVWYNSLMVQSYNYTIFDLGLSYRLMYLFAYKHTIIFYGKDIIYSPDPFGKFIFIPLSIALYLYNNILTSLLIQIIIIASGGYAVFKIAYLKTGSLLISIMIELAYFLYPQTYGFMTHGGNYQILIEGFILIGYMFYIQNKKIFAFSAFILASLTNIWAPLIVFSFILLDLITQYNLFHLRNLKNIIIKINTKHIFSIRSNKQLVFLLILFISEVSIFLQTLHFAGGINNLISASRISTGAAIYPLNGQNDIFNSIFLQYGELKLSFFLKIMLPVLFLPILTPYFFLILLYLFVSWKSSDPVYFNILQQYPSLFASFVFIGTIHFFREITRHSKNLKVAEKLAVVLLVSSFISFSLYSPFSISNFQNGIVEQNIHVSDFDKSLTYGLSLIPKNASVFIQNDLPQLMNRTGVYMPGYYNNETVGFAVIIPFGFSPTSDAYGGFSSYWASRFQNNSSYGIYEEVKGAVVYKLDYSNLPIYYVPVNLVILPGQDGLNGYSPIINNTLIMSNFKDVYDNTMWGGAYSSLSPGKYNFTFQVMTDNTSYKNVYYQDVWASDGTIKFTSVMINGSDFRHAGQWQNFTITLTLKQYYTGIEFPAFYKNWNGTVEFRGVTINQVEPMIKLFQK